MAVGLMASAVTTEEKPPHISLLLMKRPMAGGANRTPLTFNHFGIMTLDMWMQCVPVPLRAEPAAL